MSKSRPQRKLAAILVSDIHRFTDMMRRDETAAMELLRRHNAIMDAAIKRHGGDVINRMGDSYLVRIDSAVDAVECAIDAQGLFADFNEQRPRGERLAVRIGVHLGDILIEGKDIFGDGVTVASRIQAVVPPGRIGITTEVYAVVRGKVSRGFVSIGTRELKGIPEPVEVFRTRAASRPPRTRRRKKKARSGSRPRGNRNFKSRSRRYPRVRPLSTPTPT